MKSNTIISRIDRDYIWNIVIDECPTHDNVFVHRHWKYLWYSR